MSNRWELYQASFPDHTDLVSSRDTPGWVRGFFRGEGGIQGHAEFSKVDLRRPAAIGAAIVLAAGVLGTLAVVKGVPRIARWWEDHAIPTVRTVRRKITRRREVVAHDATDGAAMWSGTAIEAFSDEIDLALEDSGTGMSSAEARRRLLEILIAASIIADRVRALSDARIEDDAELPELRSVLEKLTTQPVTDTINRMLATDTSVLDDETSEIFAGIFGGGHLINGEYVPLRSDRIKEALSLDAVASTR